jgi:hypothetical protein
MATLSLIFGAVVGLSLGLTGGGGAIFAVPLLIYGLGVNPRDAVAISLAAVGATSFVGFLHRWNLREVELRTGLLFAAAGMVGARRNVDRQSDPGSDPADGVRGTDGACGDSTLATGIASGPASCGMSHPGTAGWSKLSAGCNRDVDSEFAPLPYSCSSWVS